MSPPDGTHGAPREVVGSLAQEAALLAAAVRDWAAANGGPDTADGRFDTADGQPNVAAPAGSASGATASGATAPGPEGPDAHGGRDDSWPCCACPVCRVLASVREEHAEVAGHLIDAAVSLGAAVRTAWAVRGAGGHHDQAAGDPTGRPDRAGQTDRADPAGPRPESTGREGGERPTEDRIRPAERGQGGGTGHEPFPVPGFPAHGFPAHEFPAPGRHRETGAGGTPSAGSNRPRVQKIDVR
ncbi:hypothetical protein [Parafrankia discariae]|uniref:hypothetical protein n=1 Tax=Parafrankia discariae TaxID=365528 RepID=UPI0003A8FD27|nr:hypothetical protein [Parafrankia discariae]